MMQHALGEFLAAAYAGNIEEIRSLLQRDPSLASQASVGGPSEHERDVAGIHLAAFIGNIEIMNVLVESGANINASGQAGTPLFQAVVAKQTAAVEWLFANGADVQYVHPNGETALHIAAFVGDHGIVTALIRMGADPNVCTTEGLTDTIPGSPPVMGETPLHLAAAYGHLDVIDLLLKAEADPDAEDRVGATPMHWAGRHLQTAARRKLAHCVDDRL